MELATVAEATKPPEETRSEGLPMKRPIENGGVEELAKKPKVNEGADTAASSGELKRVAEIVLVLSTMAAMRGGKKPTDVEIELMKEARMKLAELCQGMAPKDIVAREAVGTVIEDLGLNGKIKDQRLGFQAPKMSISERFSLSKLKMEESKKHPEHSAPPTSQPLQTSMGGGMVDNRMPPHTVRVHSLDKSSHTGLSSSGTIASPPVTHVSAGSSATLQYQSTTGEIKPPIVSGSMPSSHLGRNPSSVALPKVEQPQFRVDGGPSGPFMLHAQANSSSNQPLVNAPTWSIQSQTQSASFARSTQENKVTRNNPVMVEGMGDPTGPRAASQIARDQSYRPLVTQTAPGNMSSFHQPLQGMNIIQPPSLPNNHSEIAKIVQKLLQPKLPEHPTWTPPSRDYMNKAFTCQMCDLTVNEVDTVLLCDACEKGFHLKCLQPSLLRGIPRGEWHCMRCLTLSGGKALPPKYGRVMRSANTPPKLPSSTVQPTSERKTRSAALKVSSQELAINGVSVSTGAAGNNKNAELPSVSKIPDTEEMQDNTHSSSSKHMDEKPEPNISIKSLSAASSPSIGVPGESSAEQLISEPSTSKERRTFTSEPELLPQLTESVKPDNLQLPKNVQVELTPPSNNAEVPLYKLGDNSLTDNNRKETHGGESLTYDIKRDNQYVALASSDKSSGTNAEGEQCTALYSDGLNAVEWVGDLVQLVDEKRFYQSCRVNGVTYRLHDYTLFKSSHGKLIPSKLRSMFEDSKTGLKWVNVTTCYFPDDLPGNIPHPCISEVNEVYESNSDRTEMAGSIQGPCEVLPSDKFQQENNRRRGLEPEESARLGPIFLCRWFYNGVKKLFQPVTS